MGFSAAGLPLAPSDRQYPLPYPAACLRGRLFFEAPAASRAQRFFGAFSSPCRVDSRGYWYAWPYCLMQRGMNANQSSDMLADSYLGFALACVGWLALILLAVQLLLSHQDVKVR
mgnify:CR=1 FL=1